MIAARQIFLGRGAGAKLPYDAEVEYIGVSSAVGPYIDTGYAWTTDNIKIDIEFMRAGEPDFNTGLFGSQKVGQDTNWGIQFWQPSGTFVLHYIGSSGNVYNWIPTIGQKIHFVGEASSAHTWKITIDGVEHTGTWNGTVCQNVTTIGLFTLYNNYNMTDRRTKNVNVYSFKLTDNGVLVRDMTPVRFTNELGQSEGAMYDRVSGQLFRNQGTGEFGYGGDVYSVPVETSQYVQDGLVAMWDGEENAGVGKRCDTTTSWVDLSGNGYDIALPSSGATWDSDHIALSSTSLNTYLPEVNRAEFTIECVASAVGRGAMVWMKNPSWIGGALVGWANRNGNCYYPWTDIGTIGNLNLHSVSLSWSASSQNLLVDGSVIASTSGTIDSRNVLSQIFLGEYNGSKMSSMNGYSVRLFSRALTAAEIAANYAIDKARFNLP